MSSHSALFRPFLLLALPSVLLLCSGTSLAAQVSVWDSSVPEDILGGIYPIGGSGEVNEEFVVSDLIQSDTNALQLGVRARATDGSSIPFDGDRRYVAERGMTGGIANWSYDLHLDFGSNFLSVATGQMLDPQSMADYVIQVHVDVDPGAAVDFVDTVVPAVIDPIVLVQSRQNVLLANFYGGPYPGLTTPGLYAIRLSISSQGGAELVAVEMEVLVVGPVNVPTLDYPNLVLMIVLLAACGLMVVRRATTAA